MSSSNVNNTYSVPPQQQNQLHALHSVSNMQQPHQQPPGSIATGSNSSLNGVVATGTTISAPANDLGSGGLNTRLAAASIQSAAALHHLQLNQLSQLQHHHHHHHHYRQPTLETQSNSPHHVQQQPQSMIVDQTPPLQLQLQSTFKEEHHTSFKEEPHSSFGTEGATTATATANNTSAFQDLISLFECPVCFDYALPPILQCQSGHLVCSNCRPKLACCPTCRSPLSNIRNLSMEKVANSVLFPCKFYSNGCMETLMHDKKYEHEDTCECRPYNCPCPGASCKWQGSLDQVMPHLITLHNTITTLQGEDIVFLATDITLPGAVDWVMMQSCFGYNFMLVLEKQEKHGNYQQFFAIVQLIGTRKQAEQFTYRLELNGQRRRIVWEAVPRSIHDGVQQAIAQCDCLVFDTATAHLFSDAGNLGINVTITLV